MVFYHIWYITSTSVKIKFCIELIDKFQKIRQILNKHNFIVKFQATDGDVSFDQTHRTFFQDKIEPILEKPFSEIIDEINQTLYAIIFLAHIFKTV